ncbi:MAG TPA: hypothetical protein VNA12_06695, partial [Mycobacteriales bacterium]|nr:hypothetical protein [Mycobacteriales bacterium]
MSALLTRRVGAAAVAILVVAGAGIAAVSTRERRDHSQLTLTMPPGAGSADCNTFDERVLAEMPVAFSGTVTSMTAGGVQIDVDRRFRGVDPATSTVRFTTAS